MAEAPPTMLGTFARSRHVKSAHVPQNLFTRGRERKIEREKGGEGTSSTGDIRHDRALSRRRDVADRRSAARPRLSDGGQAERGGPVERRGNESMRCPFLLTRTRLPFCGLVGTRTTREGGKGTAEATARECVVWRNRETDETDVRDSRKRKRGKERERERERLYLLD